MERIDQYIRTAKTLPPAPRLLPQLMQMLQGTDVESGKVVHLITFDPGLTAKILQVCNSAVYAGSAHVSDLHEAIMRMGFAEVFRIVASVISEQALGSAQTGYGIGKGELWDHCAVTAIASRLIARNRKLDENVAFTAGLLHDIGKIVLAHALEGAYSKLIEETETKHHSLLEAERTVLGADHAAVGGRLLQQWNFPHDLVAAVTWHHDPAKAGEHKALAACVYVANLVAAFTGHSYGHQAFAVQGRDEAMEILGLNPDSMAIFMIQTIEEIKKTKLTPAA